MTKKNVLRFSPYAWAKLIHIRDKKLNEVCAFGVTHPEDPLLVIDLGIPTQMVSSCSFELSEDAMTDHIMRYVDAGYQPRDCARVWIHTHPAGITTPSSTDERTFSQNMTDSDWAIMFILPKGTETGYCEIQYKTPSIKAKIEHCIDWTYPFDAANHESWDAEFDSNVSEQKTLVEIKSIPQIFSKNARKNKYKYMSSLPAYQNEPDSFYGFGDFDDI